MTSTRASVAIGLQFRFAEPSTLLPLSYLSGTPALGAGFDWLILTNQGWQNGGAEYIRSDSEATAAHRREGHHENGPAEFKLALAFGREPRWCRKIPEARGRTAIPSSQQALWSAVWQPRSCGSSPRLPVV